MKTPLANEFFGFIGWIWMVLGISEDKIFEECTFDFLVVHRILGMGIRISVVAVVNAIWLLPLYATAPISPETSNVTDPVASVTIANVPPGSARLIGPALSAYIFFGYAMYTIFHEFSWYTRKRHEFLMRTEARNYTVYVRNIPCEYRSNIRLMEFFRHIYSHATVVEVHFLIRLPSLSKLVARRDNVLAKLERALVLRETTGREPTHYSLSFRSREELNSIDVFAQELADLNKEIKERIQEVHREEMNKFRQLSTGNIQTDSETATSKLMAYPETHSSVVHVPESAIETDSLLDHAKESRISARAYSLLTGTVPTDDYRNNEPNGSTENPLCHVDSPTKSGLDTTADASTTEQDNDDDADDNNGTQTPDTNRSRSNLRTVATTMKFGLNIVNTVASKTTQGVNAVASTAVSTVATTATSAVSTVANTAAQAAALLRSQDGEHDDAAFVVFSQLSAVHSTMQM